MSPSLAEALAPLRRAMGGREAERLVLRAGLEAGGHRRDALAAALGWAARATGLEPPDGAAEGTAFEAHEGAAALWAAEAETEEAWLWGLRVEAPDPAVPGLVAITELALSEPIEGRLRLALRLAARGPLDALDRRPPVPDGAGCLAALAGGPGLRADGAALPLLRPVGDQAEAEAFLRLLLDPGRRLPVLALSVVPPEEGAPAAPLLDPLPIARRLAGLAHVALLSEAASWALTNRLDRTRSVFGGAARLFWPGFGPAADLYAHPLALLARMEPEARVRRLEEMAREVVEASLDRGAWAFDLPTVSAIRGLAAEAAAVRAEAEAAQRAAARAAEGAAAPDGADALPAALRAHAAALEAELAERTAERDYAIDEAEDERARADDLDRRLKGALARLAAFEEAARRPGGAPPAEEPGPEAWGDIAPWVDRALAGRVALTPAARRMLRAPLYAGPPHVAAGLRWLAEVARPRLLEGGGTLDGAAVEGAPGPIRNEPCGGDAFAFRHDGRSLLADWHLKNGGNTRDPARCLRIYWAWDEATRQVVVAHLPSHRVTGAT